MVSYTNGSQEKHLSTSEGLVICFVLLSITKIPSSRVLSSLMVYNLLSLIISSSAQKIKEFEVGKLLGDVVALSQFAPMRLIINLKERVKSFFRRKLR